MTGRLVRAEWLKVRTVRSSAGLLAALASLVVATVVVPVTAVSPHTGRFALAGAFAQRTLACAGAIAAGTILLIFGVLATAGESRHGTLTPTLLVTPRRARVILAKATVHATLGLGVGGTAALTAVATVVLGCRLRGVTLVLHLPDLAAIVAGGALYGGLAALLGLGVGAAVRDPVIALAGIFTLFFVVENVLATVAPAVARWLPGQAGSALAFPPAPGVPGTAHVVGQVTGGVVFAAYAAVALAAGLLAMRRDVT
jgi:ABC-2 type transport system permease protein